MKDWLIILDSIADFSPENIENKFKSFLEETRMGIGAVLPNFRLLITGNGTGPSMFEISSFLGKEECIERMKIGLEKITAIKS